MTGSHLPPMQTLRAFEAAVRLGSFTRAADELALTQGAISQHVRALEMRLDTVLFVRERFGAVATPEAHALALQVRQGLEVLQRAFERVPMRRRARDARKSESTKLTLSVLPSFASRWLAPRLPGFMRRHPDIALQLRPEVALARFDRRDGVDVALRYGPGAWPGLQAERLMDEEIFAVASPAYREGRLPRRFADLARCTLLRHASQPWEPWFQAVGLDLTEPREGPLFTDAGALVVAATNGLGIALVRATLVEAELAKGALVRLWRRSIKDIYAHFVVWRSDTAKRDAIDALRQWLHEEVAAAATRYRL